MKIHPLRVEVFHSDGRKDRHDEATSLFFTILRKRPKNTHTHTHTHTIATVIIF